MSKARLACCVLQQGRKSISFWDTWGPGHAIDQVPKQRTCTCKQDFVYSFKWKIKFLLFHLIVVSALLLMLFAQFYFLEFSLSLSPFWFSQYFRVDNYLSPWVMIWQAVGLCLLQTFVSSVQCLKQIRLFKYAKRFIIHSFIHSFLERERDSFECLLWVLCLLKF